MRENRTYGLKRGHVRNYVPDGSTLPGVKSFFDDCEDNRDKRINDLPLEEERNVPQIAQIDAEEMFSEDECGFIGRKRIVPKVAYVVRKRSAEISGIWCATKRVCYKLT